MTLATFSRFKVKIPGVSIELTASDEAQFTDKLESSNHELLGQYVTSIFEMKDGSGSFTHRERGQFGIHYVNSTSGALDTTWTSADFAAVESALQAYWTSDAGAICTGCRLVEHRWYPFGPGYVGTKSAPIPPSRVTTLGTPIVGTGSEPWVRQVGSTVTLRTTLRRHWGRFYVPLMSSMFSTNGQMSAGAATSQANLARTMLLAAESSQGVVPVVYDRTRKQVYGVTSVEVDTVPDIQRRRRPRDYVGRTILSA